MSPAVALVAGIGLLGATVALARFPLRQLAFFTVGLLVLTITWNGIRIGGGAFANGFLVLATLAVIAHVIIDREQIVIPPWLYVSAAGMIVAALLVGMFPPSLQLQNRANLQYDQFFLVAGAPITTALGNRSNLAALDKFEIALLIVPAIVATVASTPTRINRLLDLWTISATVNALVGLADYAGLHSLASEPIVGHRSGGLTVHPNYLALTCALAIPVALRRVGTSQRATTLGLLAGAILLGGEFATGSRDGIVAAGIAVLLSIAAFPRLRPALRLVMPAIGIGLVATLMFTHAGRSIINQLRLGGPTTSTTGSDYQRAVFAHVAEGQISARPLIGVGFSVDNDAQNIYLQILAAGGLVATAAFLVFIAGLAGAVRRSLRGPVRDAAVAIGIAVVVWLINGYYDAQIADKYLYVLPALLIACARISRRPVVEPTRSPPLGGDREIRSAPQMAGVAAGG